MRPIPGAAPALAVPVSVASAGGAARAEATAAQATNPEGLKAFVLGAKAHTEASADTSEGAKLGEGLKPGHAASFQAPDTSRKAAIGSGIYLDTDSG